MKKVMTRVTKEVIINVFYIKLIFCGIGKFIKYIFCRNAKMEDYVSELCLVWEDGRNGLLKEMKKEGLENDQEMLDFLSSSREVGEELKEYLTNNLIK